MGTVELQALEEISASLRIEFWGLTLQVFGVSGMVTLKTRRAEKKCHNALTRVRKDIFYYASFPTPRLVPNYIRCFRFPTFPNLD